MVTTNSEVWKKTREEKVAILRGKLTVSRSEMDVGDWCAVIASQLTDFKPYLNYLSGYKTLDERVSEFKSRYLNLRVYAWLRVKVIIVFQWALYSMPGNFRLALGSDGELYKETVFRDPDYDSATDGEAWRYRLQKLGDSELEALILETPVADMGERIATGVYQAFAETVKARTETLCSMTSSRDDLQATVGHRLVN